MKAFIFTSFDRGFLLSEESIIKLSDIINKRLRDKGAKGELEFKIYRNDGALIVATDHNVVISEENAIRNAIKKLEISFISNDVSFGLIFDPEKKVDLSVEGGDKDVAYLLFSDVKEYLTSEVLRFRSFKFSKILESRLTLPIFATGFMLSFSLSMFKSKNSTVDIDSLIKSGTTDEKINALLVNISDKNADIDRLSKNMWLYFLLLTVGVGGIALIALWLDRIYPRNVFYFGKAKIAYDRLISNREKIYWGVLVAFVVGVAVTLFVDYAKI